MFFDDVKNKTAFIGERIYIYEIPWPEDRVTLIKWIS